VPDATDELERGRESYVRRAWKDAYDSLSGADEAAGLGAADLELLATSAYMLGRDDEHAAALERAHHAYVEDGATLYAARCGFWLGITLMLRRELGRATGWFGRAQRLVEREQRECVERGYLLVPLVEQHLFLGEYGAAYDAAGAAAAIAERFGDGDLLALAVHKQGYALVKQGRIDEGLGLLDEAMVAVTAGELTPIVTGLVYCSVIAGCQEVHAVRRADEWTTALTQWCDQQPDIVAFTGRCLVHRAEIMRMRGAWSDALEEARQAGRRFALGGNRAGAADAYYQQGEVHRLRGTFAAAEEAYREASRCGVEPQPGLALLRLAQGNGDAAAAAIRRALGETSDRLERTRLLPAHVHIALAIGEVEEAAGACRELAELSAGAEDGMLGAMAGHARGAVALAEGDAGAALVALRQAWRVWQDLGVPYEAARARLLVGLACRALSDADGGALELEAARDAFEQLGAAPDLASVDALTGRAEPADAHGLTQREMQVLRLVAAGETNRAIAAELVVSQRTVDRHVSNIFAKLGVSSRAAATAYAYEHRVI
jgi:DNA-binding CsgD family transcriptional regulator/tetratricopeptide (TPR) repeat protein